LDDTPLVQNRIDYLKNPAHIFDSFKESVMYWQDRDAFYYRPILTVSFILDAFIFRGNFWGYHISNIIYHIISTILVYNLLLKLKARKNTAKFFSFLFAIHPVFIQAIAWVPGRNDTILLMFGISAFFYFINYLIDGHLKDLAFFTFFFFLSIFSKETAAVFLLIFPLYYFLVFDQKKKVYLKRLLILMFISFFLVFLWYFMARKFSDTRNSYLSLILHINWPQYLIKEVIPGYLIYLGKFFVPVSLSVFPLVIGNSLNLLLGLLFFSLILISYFFGLSEKKKALFGIFWFLILLFPTLIKVMVSEPLIIYEHRLYLPSFGILFFFSQVDFLSSLLKKKYAFRIIVFLLFIFYLLINRSHIYNFKDSLSFWKAAYSTSSAHYVTSVGLSAEYLIIGDFDNAENVFKHLDEIKPDSEISHLGFASLYYHKKDFDKSKAEAKKALERNPNSVRARHYIANIEGSLGRYDEAEKYYLEAISLDSDNVDILMGLVYLYFKQGKMDEALKFYNKVKELGVQF
jgi:pentatricopeptide repeat protein